MKLFLDVETFYDSKLKYDLRNISIVEYCRDPRFKLHGLGFAFENGEIGWTNDLETFIAQVRWDQVNVISHNIKFDLFALVNKYEIRPKSFIDTKAMSKAVLGTRISGHSLNELAAYYGLPLKGKMKTDGIRDLSPEQEKELAEYCLHDVWLCREIYKKLAEEFPENQYPIMSKTIDMFVNPKLELDIPLLEKAAKDEEQRRETIFQKIGIPKEEFSSNKKFPDLLGRKGYEVPTKISPSTGKLIPALALGDTQFLELAESGNEELKQLCEARAAAKSTLLATRSAKLARIGRTGRWPFDVEFSGAKQTHRFSGGSGAGGNPQNFTRDSALREAVKAPAGYKLIAGDFSNIEMRLVAYLAGDRGLIEAIEQERDVYCDFASAFFGRKITKADDKERRFGKTAILGLGYGMGAKKFVNTVKIQTGQTITQDEAYRAVNLYRKLYFKVPQLWATYDNNIRFLLSHPAITIGFLAISFESICLPSGLKLQYPNLRKEGKEWVYDVRERKAGTSTRHLYGGKLLENICQALAGEICKDAMMKLGEDVVGQVHDELHLLVPEGIAEVAAEVLEKYMSESPAWMPELKLKAEVKIGDNWRSCK